MFKNAQLVLLPQHMRAENKGGRNAWRRRSRDYREEGGGNKKNEDQKDPIWSLTY